MLIIWPGIKKWLRDDKRRQRKQVVSIIQLVSTWLPYFWLIVEDVWKATSCAPWPKYLPGCTHVHYHTAGAVWTQAAARCITAAMQMIVRARAVLTRSTRWGVATRHSVVGHQMYNQSRWSWRSEESKRREEGVERKRERFGSWISKRNNRPRVQMGQNVDASQVTGGPWFSSSFRVPVAFECAEWWQWQMSSVGRKSGSPRIDCNSECLVTPCVQKRRRKKKFSEKIWEEGWKVGIRALQGLVGCKLFFW